MLFRKFLNKFLPNIKDQLKLEVIYHLQPQAGIELAPTYPQSRAFDGGKSKCWQNNSEEAMEKSVLALLRFEVRKYYSRLKKRIVLETEIYILWPFLREFYIPCLPSLHWKHHFTYLLLDKFYTPKKYASILYIISFTKCFSIFIFCTLTIFGG